MPVELKGKWELTTVLDAILNFLYDHIDRSIDSQVRARWEPYTVVLWDNRVTAHVRGVFCLHIPS